MRAGGAWEGEDLAGASRGSGGAGRGPPVSLATPVSDSTGRPATFRQHQEFQGLSFHQQGLWVAGSLASRHLLV